MNFNFSNLSNTSFSSDSQSYLKPYDIHKVILSKIEKSVLKGSKDPNASFDIIAIEFTGVGDSKGIFSTNLFVPNKDDDFERTVNKTSGKTQPSSFERFQFTLMQIVEAINPSGAQKIKENASKLKTIDQFIDLVIKALTGKKTEVYLKLVGRNNNGKIYSSLPTSCWLDGDTPKPLNFINADSTKLNFSNYEMTQAKNYKEAKPTEMKDNEGDNNPDTKETEDINLDELDI